MSGYGQNQVAPTGYGYNIPQRAQATPQPVQSPAMQQQVNNPFTGGAGRGMGGRIMGYGMNFMRGAPEQRRFGIPEMQMGGPQNYATAGPYNLMVADMARGQMGSYGFGGGGFGYSPYGYGGGPIRGSWPSWGQGGMSGRFNNARRGGSHYGGYLGGSGFGYGGVPNPYGPGSYSAPGSMPFGGGSGMWGGGWRSPFAALW